ncbi:unnamed protein product [Durusdinium trenchii]|uniref:Ion transport domain-containing protein n=1 Tax=Durusdinium trenchii TaxID=1381693 RepID=A0ABP0IBI6_9DINO
MNVADYEMRFDALKAMERSMSGNFEKKPELQKVQRESNDASLGVIREWRPLHQSDTPLASIRDLEAARRGNLMPFKSMRCPTSPLCLQCEWPQRRSWLLCGLLKKLKMPTKVVKLVLGFARQHRPVRAVDLPPRTELRVRWWDPLEENVTQEEQEQESNKGTVTCEYYDPASLAMELHAMTMYPIDDFKMLRGGVLHLVGEFQLFWSAVLNFADFHSCAPLEGLYKWGETVPRLEYRRMCQCLQSGSPKMQSRSRFALLMCRELCSGADELNRTLPPCAYTELDDEAVTPGEPIARWWHDVVLQPSMDQMSGVRIGTIHSGVLMRMHAAFVATMQTSYGAALAKCSCSGSSTDVQTDCPNASVTDVVQPERRQSFEEILTDQLDGLKSAVLAAHGSVLEDLQLRVQGGCCETPMIHELRETREQRVPRERLSWDLIFIPLQMFDINAEVDNLINAPQWQSGRDGCDGTQIDEVLVLDVMIFVVLSFNTESESGSNDSMGSFRLARALRLMRFLRLLRLHKMANLAAEILDRFKTDSFLLTMNILRSLAAVLALNHYMSCAFLGLALLFAAEGELTWIEIAELQHMDFLTQYFSALHWSLTQFMPATNNIAPNTAPERIYAIFVVLIGLAVFSSFVSGVTNTVNQLRQIHTEHFKQESRMKSFLTQKSVSVDVWCRVQKFCRLRILLDKMSLKEGDIPMLQDLPHGLRVKLHAEIYMPILVSANWMPSDVTEIDEELMLKLCDKVLLEKVASPMQEIFLERGECPEVGTWLCELSLWARWEYRGQLDTEEVSHYVVIPTQEFALAVTKAGGSLFQLIRTIGLLYIAKAESQDANCDGIPLTDLPLLSESDAQAGVLTDLGLV